MSGSVNKVILIGNLGNDPEIRHTQSGDKIANLSIATTESWKDRNSGERKQNTDWHRVVIFSQGLASIVEQYAKKGHKIYVEGSVKTRKYQGQDGTDKYITEIVVGNYGGSITLLGGQGASNSQPYSGGDSFGGSNQSSYKKELSSKDPESSDVDIESLHDEIPF